MMNNTNYEKLRLSLLRLQERYIDYTNSFDRNNLLDSDREALQESCIHRFETCFDTLWKHLKKYLEEEIGLVEVPNGPRPVFRLSAENYVLEDFEIWYNYNQKRIGTSHDYSEEKADKVIEILPDFIEDVIAIYEKITNTTWQNS